VDPWHKLCPSAGVFTPLQNIGERHKARTWRVGHAVLVATVARRRGRLVWLGLGTSQSGANDQEGEHGCGA
jgi:hypothetical protein